MSQPSAPTPTPARPTLLMLVQQRLLAVLALAAITTREALTRPITWILVGISVGLLLLSRTFNLFAMGEELALLRDVGLAAIRMCGLALIIFQCCGAISEEVDRHRLLSILSKPIARGHYVLGKYLGLLIAISVLSLLLGLVLAGLIALDQNRWDVATFIGLLGEIMHAATLLAVAMIFAPHAKFVTSSIVVLLSFIGGHLADWLGALLDGSSTAFAPLRAAIQILPKLQNFVLPSTFAAQGRYELALDMLSLTFLYSVSYVLFCLLIASYIYRYREIG